jgi:N-methylhydantoinase A/oxoprolinase/acetone carboxylase beta subunit
MRTVGLGGDSRITLERRELRIGPRRVAPVSWLASRHDDTGAALAWIERHLDYFNTSTTAIDLVAPNGREADFELDDAERRALDLIAVRPYSMQELASNVHGNPWRMPDLERLEERQLVQRCGLTPTDLLHVLGEIDLWDRAAAGLLCEQFARILDIDREAFARRGIERVIRTLAVELLKTQMAEQVDSAVFEDSPGTRALIENLLSGRDEGFHVRVQLRRPVIGIGAPVHAFLPQAARILEAECIIPPDADVANAIGAITSSVMVHRQLTLAPNESGRYALAGLPDAPTFMHFEDANAAALERLQGLVRDDARRAGTSQTRVEIIVEDHIGHAASGEAIFLGRTLEARLSGRPDLARLAARCG